MRQSAGEVEEYEASLLREILEAFRRERRRGETLGAWLLRNRALTRPDLRADQDSDDG